MISSGLNQKDKISSQIYKFESEDLMDFYILPEDFSTLTDAVAAEMTSREFLIHRAAAAGLTPGETDGGEGVYLRTDAEFSVSSLAAAVKKKRKNSVRLTTPTGLSVGFILKAEDAADPDPQALETLPSTVLKDSDRVSSANAADILFRRQEEVLTALTAEGVFAEEGAIVSPLYTIGEGSWIGKNCRLLGKGSIGKNCVITGDSLLTDVELGDHVIIRSSMLTDAVAEDGVTIGPFAQLRPNTFLKKNVHVGDFVEVKNSTIGEGTKVCHLTYVGDSDVGARVNFGCGTVTSNYDGLKKNRCVIGDGAFIGCNTNLVAPVKVGDHVYIAAGSTVTEDIPEGALAIARSRQTNKEDWVAKRKPDLLKK